MVQGASGAERGPPIRVAPGPRATEALLLEELVARAREARADPALLAQPVRVVVPSASLREHLAAALVRAVGGSVAGVQISTLHGLAHEILERACEPAAPGDDLFPVLVRRAARGEVALREVLDDLEDGYGSVTAAVADLLDAAFDGALAAHRDALDDALAAAHFPDAVTRRVRAIAGAASATARALAELGCTRRGDRQARAAERLLGDPALLPARCLYIHGFADATAVASDLLEVLVSRGAVAFFDLPPDPAAPDHADLGGAFAQRLLRRLGATGREVAQGKAEPPRVELLRAAGSEAEVRAVADRIHALLDSEEVVPERIGVVLRDPAPVAAALRTHFGRLGIPFSARESLGPPAGRERQLHALLEILSEGEAVRAERWLDAARAFTRSQGADLRLGLHALGVARLGQLAGLDAERRLQGRGGLPLPARRGLAAAPEGSGDDVGPFARRRRLSRELFEEAVGRAARTREHLESWPARAPLSAHRRCLEGLLGEAALGWGRNETSAALRAAVARLSAELPDLELGFEEWVLLLRRALRRIAGTRLGGAGAGVQLLSVVEARGRSFDHLFLLGMNRDSFPRPLLDDPLLPDRVRRSLETILPEMPVKARGFEEEHYLFAQLMASSPRVTLSWQVADDDGRARSPSVFVERLRSAGLALPHESVPSLQASPERWRGRPRTAAEAAVGEALYGAPRRFAELFAAAVAEREVLDRAGGVRVEPGALARGRLAVLQEFGDYWGRAEIGPYLGFVGPVRSEVDLRRAPLYITGLERIARCPWQFFLTRLLGLEPPPDALDQLPVVDALLVGSLVHAVLEGIVEGALPDAPRELEEAGAQPGGEVPWPEPEALEARIRACADALLASEGIGPPGFARILVEAARPLVEAARHHAWPAPGSGVRCLGGELHGSAPVGTPPRTIHFRADRVDRVEGALRLVDYKTGKPLVGKTAAKLRASLLKKVAGGENLQAPAYAFGTGSEGRYLYLKLGAEAAAVVRAEHDDPGLRQAFGQTAQAVLAAFDSGSFFPRLAAPGDTGEHSNCKTCDVRQACLQGDAGARLRLGSWAELGRQRTQAERAARTLWWLGEPS